MDLSSLSHAFSASIAPDPKIRLSAESHLKANLSNPQLPFACLNLAVSNDVDPVTQQSAAVFLKNIILKYWKHIPQDNRSSSTNSAHQANQNNTINQNNHQPSVTDLHQPTPPDESTNTSITFINQQYSLNISPSSMTSSSPGPASNNNIKSTSTSSLKAQNESPFRNYSKSEILQFKNQALYSLSLASPAVINNFTTIIATFLSTSGIQEWTDLIPNCIKMINDPSPSVVCAGVLVALEIMRHLDQIPLDQQQQPNSWAYQLKSDTILGLFPPLLKIASSLSSETLPRASFIVWKILKCYKFAVHYDIPEYLQQEAQLKDWLGLLLHIVSLNYNNPAPSPTTNESFQFKLLSNEYCSRINTFAKCKKWACYILAHLMVTYTEGTNVSVPYRPKKDYKQFSNIYLQYFAPNISLALINDIQQWDYTNRDSESSYLLCSIPKAVSSILSWFDAIITVDTLWNTILPKMETILSRLIFGTIVLSESDIETMYYSPEEYVINNVENSDFSIRYKALKYFSSLVSERRADMFQGILIFINQYISKYSEAPHNLQYALEKDGALQMMIELKEIVTSPSSPVAPQIHLFVMDHVVGESAETITHPFILARCCQFIETFDNVVYSQQELECVFTFVMTCFNSSSAVVRFYAVMALRNLFNSYQTICKVLGPQVPHIMKKMIEIHEEIHSEIIFSVMEDLIDKFSEEVAPFSAQLCSELCQQFFRIVNEVNERVNIRSSRSFENDEDLEDVEEEDFSYIDDHQMVAAGLLNTLSTLLIALESFPDYITKLEPYLLPVFQTVIENANYTYYQEVFELIDTCLYTDKCVTPSMAQVIGMMQKGFNKDPSECCDYFGPVLCNFIKFTFPGPIPPHSQSGILTTTTFPPQNATNHNSNNSLKQQFGRYPPGLRTMVFDFVCYFLKEVDNVTGESIEIESKLCACTLAQTFFLTSTSCGARLDFDDDITDAATSTTKTKRMNELITLCLSELYRCSATSVVLYRALVEVILAAALYDAPTVCRFLISCNCFDWIIDVASTRSDLLNRPADHALTSLSLLKIAVACAGGSENFTSTDSSNNTTNATPNGDSSSNELSNYTHVFGKILKPVLEYISAYYNHLESNRNMLRSNQLLYQQIPQQQKFQFVAYNGEEQKDISEPQQQQKQTFEFQSYNPEADDDDNNNEEDFTLKEMMLTEPALENALEPFNLYKTYQDAIRVLTQQPPKELEKNGKSLISSSPSSDTNNTTAFPPSPATPRPDDNNNSNSKRQMYFYNTLNECLKDQDLNNIHASIMSLSSL